MTITHSDIPYPPEPNPKSVWPIASSRDIERAVIATLKRLRIAEQAILGAQREDEAKLLALIEDARKALEAITSTIAPKS